MLVTQIISVYFIRTAPYNSLVIQVIYFNPDVSTVTGTSEAFDIRVRVHQGSAFSPLLFIVIMDEATKLTRGDGPLELLYADDLVLTAESKEEVTDMFNR